MISLYKRIIKYKATIIPIVAAISNFIPFHLCSESLTLLLWTFVCTVLFSVLEQYPFFEISFAENSIHTSSDILIDLSENNNQKHELNIRVKPHKIKKIQYDKVLEIDFPSGVSISSSSKKEQKYIKGNKVEIPIKELSNDGQHKLVFALGLEEEKFSGEDSPIQCKCEGTIIKCKLINKASIHWE